MDIPPFWIVHCPHPVPPAKSVQVILDEDRGPRIILCEDCYAGLRKVMEDDDGRTPE